MDDKLTQLLDIFPEFDTGIALDVLERSDGNVDKVRLQSRVPCALPWPAAVPDPQNVFCRPSSASRR